LFDLESTPDKVRRDTQAATNFFKWLREKLHGRYEIDDALVRVCVPELRSDILKAGVNRLREAFELAGWSKAQWLHVAEPKANVLGLASRGRNCVNLSSDRRPIAFLPEIYDSNSPLLRVARNVVNGGQSRKAVTIDIGAFTTDIAICAVAEEVKIEQQFSFKHGVALLDEALRSKLKEDGLDTAGLSHAEFELNKRMVYEGNASQWVVGKSSVTLPENCMEITLTEFTDELLRKCLTHTTAAHWFMVTGGGSEIPAILTRIRTKLEAADLKYVQDLFPDLDQRIATALGGASVVLDFSDSADSTQNELLTHPLSETSAGVPCECNGGNKDCIRCQGTGWLQIKGSSPTKPRNKLPSSVEYSTHNTHPSHPDPLKPLVETFPDRSPESPDKPLATNEKCSPAQPESTKPELTHEFDKRIKATAIAECWRGHEVDALKQFGLEGWMGELIFTKPLRKAHDRSNILQNDFSPEGKAAWLRLLCLSACLSVRAKPQYIRKFWNEKLSDVWQAMIPADLEQLPHQQLNEVFTTAIHLEFNDLQATGEDAELWRRVFYDFRKLHHFVYQNDLPRSLLEAAVDSDSGPNSLVHFLKSGLPPDGQKRWVGAIGQSMTAPLLFLLRELRRLELIGPRFDSTCFYMNSPTRRVARQLGWISGQESTYFDIESLVAMSQTCHQCMKTELPELLPFFDLPLQWYAHKNPR